MFRLTAIWAVFIIGLISVAPSASSIQVTGPAPAISGAVAGGDLYVYRTRDFRYLDPTRLFNVDEVVFGNFLFRTLTQYRTINGKTELLPDLATSLGKPSKDFKTWTYPLRSGIKFQTGQAVTCQDIKYGISRSFADDILTGGAPYAKMYLQIEPPYRGPYNEPNKDLTSIRCNKSNTAITFRLNRPVPNFDQIAALPSFSPVPKSQDTKQLYGNNPIATGPYQLQSWAPGKELVLVHNKNWNKNTDPIRWRYPNRIVVKLALQADVMEQMLVADRGESQQAVMMDTWVLANRQNVNNLANLKSRSTNVIDPPAWLAINVDTVKNLKVRKAIQCAVDYRIVTAAAGGQQYASVASSIIPKMFKGAYRDYQICNRDLRRQPQAQQSRVIKLLTNATAEEKKLSVAFSDRGNSPLLANAVAQSLRAAGFQVLMNRIPQNLFSATIRERKSGAPDVMIWDRWRPDWQAASGQIYPLLDGRTMSPTSAGNNFARQNFDELQKLFVRSDQVTSLKEQEKLLGDIEQLAVTKYAVMLPLISQRLIYLHGSKVGGVQVSQGHNTLTFAAAYIKR